MADSLIGITPRRRRSLNRDRPAQNLLAWRTECRADGTMPVSRGDRDLA